MDPECTSDPNGMAAPDAIHPIFAQSIEFLKALIEKDKSGEGTMSRPTKLAIENSIKGFKDSEFTVVPTERSNWLATKVTTNIQTDMVQRVEDDKNYIEARFRLEALRRDLWYLRYGDYFTANISLLGPEVAALRREAKRIKRDA